VVETQFGFHLIKVTDIKEAGVTTYDDIKAKIEQHLKQDKVNKELTAYVDQLKSQAKVETFLK
jgi:parvulin-like peptidyl-prolyl isomerase